ncbi:MAG: hypothetical protein WDN02_15135 [Methylovirgula sp.]|uniref:hypothetical protein n=1 Tax=Methylovirgula sp. TaxID=1978224 RepID=UPI00307664DC
MESKATDPVMPESLYDILTAWQSGSLTARRAMRRAGLDTVGDLYAAAASSGVRLRRHLLTAEQAASDAATKAIRKKLTLATKRQTEAQRA